jgi:hypothetical protein
MKRTRSFVVGLFLAVPLFGLSGRAMAEDPGSLLGTIINEAVRQSQGGAQQGYSPYGDDDYYHDRYYDSRQGKKITCESRSGQYNYCRTDVRGRIRLDRQLSEASCRQYDTWGVDGDGGGIWVSDGCRATFIVEPRRAEPRYGDGGGRGRGKGETITCESRSGQYNYCRTNRQGRVRLERQLSSAPCREYDTWGVDGDGGGVWVSDGCRATFSVEDRDYSYGRGRGEREQTIICKSDNYRSTYCRTNTRGDVRLERQLSEAPCREYDTWGSDRDGGGIWVDQGCAGEFSIR